MLALAKERARTIKEPVELSDALIKTLAFTAAGSIAPIASVVGGIVAQEVIKVGQTAHAAPRGVGGAAMTGTPRR